MTDDTNNTNDNDNDKSLTRRTFKKGASVQVKEDFDFLKAKKAIFKAFGLEENFFEDEKKIANVIHVDFINKTITTKEKRETL